MYILFIDDSQERHEIVEWYLGKDHLVLHAYTYEDAVEYLQSAQYRVGLACFDHDLGDIRDGVEFGGSKVADFILRELNEGWFPLQAVVHSMNFTGAANIASKLRTAGIPTRTMMFSNDMIKGLAEELTPQ